jgi:hypothetical protein
MTTSEIETDLQTIADALNDKNAEMPSGYDKIDGGYNHYWHAVELGEMVGIEVDDDRHERENRDASDEIFFEGGWSLVLSCDEWAVSEPDGS